MSYRLKCPICGNTINELCLYSYPAHYEAKCSDYNNCGFSLKYTDRKNSFVPVNQKELDNYKV
jgi:hypothetical protein